MGEPDIVMTSVGQTGRIARTVAVDEMVYSVETNGAPTDRHMVVSAAGSGRAGVGTGTRSGVVMPPA